MEMKVISIAKMRLPTYEFGEDIENLDGTQISAWLSVSEDGDVVLDESGVKEYVDYIGKTYNTFGKT